MKCIGVQVKIFEIVDGQTTTDGWMAEHGHPISSPCEPLA